MEISRLKKIKLIFIVPALIVLLNLCIDALYGGFVFDWNINFVFHWIWFFKTITYALTYCLTGVAVMLTIISIEKGEKK